MKGKGGKGQGGQRDEEEDEYMRRIRARMEIDQDPDEYSDGDGADEEEASEASGQEEEEVGSDAGSDEEEEDNEDGFAPGRGYDTEEDGSDTGPSSSDDEAGRAKQEALAAVRGLPLAERLALMASGALHDTEGAGGVVCTSRRRRRMAGAGAGAQGGDAAVGKAEDGVGKAKPKNKHAPTELSSKKPVPRLGAVGAGAGAAMAPTGSGKWRKARDPRFDPALGKVNYDAFRQAYGFLEGYQEKELQALQAAMKKAKSHTKRAELKAAMNAIRQERSERQRADRTRALLRGAKREERGKVAAGKAPFFLKKRDKRRLELEDRYEQLAKEGKLERALSKKRRRNAAKDHRWLPRSRRMGDGVGGGGAEGVGGGGGDDEGRGWM